MELVVIGILAWHLFTTKATKELLHQTFWTAHQTRKKIAAKISFFLKIIP